MAAGNTYVAIRTETLTTTAASVTFSNIPGTYTDLVLIFNGGGTGGGDNMLLSFNGDVSTNYSQTILRGSGTSLDGYRENAFVGVRTSYATAFSAGNAKCISISNIMSYANSTTFKTVLTRAGAPDTGYKGTEIIVSLWRATPAPITTILCWITGGLLLAGSTFSLYGIAAA